MTWNVTTVAQDSLLHLYVSDTSVELDAQVCVDVRVNNYDSIEAFQLSMNFDPYLLKFDSLSNLNQLIELDPFDFGLQERHRGIIRLTYFNPFESFSLPDSTILFSMCFTATGDPNELCPVNVSDYPLNVEFISKEEIVDGPSRRNGTVDITGSDELTLLLNSCTTGFNDTTGSFSLSVYGGNPPYFAIWQHTFNSNFSGGFGLDTFGDRKVIGGLIEGRYRITLSDQDGNVIRDSINLLKSAPVHYVEYITHPTCDNTADGAIFLDSISGGLTPIQFKWNDGELFQTSRENLSVGLYQVTVTLPMGCRLVDSFELEANSIQTTLDITDASCLGSEDGAFSLIAAGGAPWAADGYNFIFDDDTIRGYARIEDALAAGNYAVLIEDSVGCIKNVDVRIGPGITFEPDVLDIEPIDCFGERSGSIFFRPRTVNGTEQLPYVFGWIGTEEVIVDSVSIQLINLGPGSYTISVGREDLPGCSWDTTIILVEPPLLEIETDSVRPATCDPGGDGQATISITGGRPVNDDDYFIFWEIGQDSVTAVGLDAGTYRVIVSDQGGCQMSHDVVVPQTEGPAMVGASVLGMRCDSLPVGSIVAVFNSPFGIEGYLWSTGDTTATIDSLSPGRYQCVVTDINGCTDTFDVDATTPEGPHIIDVLEDRIHCPGDSNGGLFAQYELGVGLLDSIFWNDVYGPDSLTHLVADTYQVVVRDLNYCSDTMVHILVNPDSMHLSFEVTNDTNNQGVGQVIVHVEGGWSPYTYHWQHDTSAMDSLISGLHSGPYLVSVFDAEGCMAMDSVFVDMISGIGRQEDNSKRFTLFPNPAGSYLYIEWHPSNTTPEHITIYSMDGRQIRQQSVDTSNQRIAVRVDDLQSGMYMLKLTTQDGHSMVRRFEKM